MAKNAEEISKYAFGPADELLLDANVWFFVYGPHRPGDPRAVVYSGALARILNAKSRIYVDVLIVSEFVNAYARLRYNILRGRPGVPGDFKRFRKSSTFKAIAKDIAADVRKLLANCARVESGFGTLDIESLVTEYEQGDSDFNDLVLADLCKSKGLKLVTNDGDFKGKNVVVLTANKRLLN
ncbi:MAG: PIN domain-containing protein [Candidatus Binatia bacterium]